LIELRLSSFDSASSGRLADESIDMIVGAAAGIGGHHRNSRHDHGQPRRFSAT